MKVRLNSLLICSTITKNQMIDWKAGYNTLNFTIKRTYYFTIFADFTDCQSHLNNFKNVTIYVTYKPTAR